MCHQTLAFTQSHQMQKCTRIPRNISFLKKDHMQNSQSGSKIRQVHPTYKSTRLSCACLCCWWPAARDPMLRGANLSVTHLCAESVRQRSIDHFWDLGLLHHKSQKAQQAGCGWGSDETLLQVLAQDLTRHRQDRSNGRSRHHQTQLPPATRHNLNCCRNQKRKRSYSAYRVGSTSQPYQQRISYTHTYTYIPISPSGTRTGSGNGYLRCDRSLHQNSDQKASLLPWWHLLLLLLWPPARSGRESTGSPHGDMKTTVGQTSASVFVPPPPPCRILAESSVTFLGIRAEVILPHLSFLTWNKQGGEAEATFLPFSAASSHRHRDVGAAATSSRHSSRWYWNKPPRPPTLATPPVSWKKPIMAASHCKSCKAGDIGHKTTSKEGAHTHRPHGQ